MSAFLVVVGLVVAAFLLPAKYDPAIRLREWLSHKDHPHD